MSFDAEFIIDIERFLACSFAALMVEQQGYLS